MNETLQALRDFAATPFGRTVLIVGAILAVALIVVPLWRSFKYLVRALLWALLAVVVLGAAGAAVWWWMDRNETDPERRAAFRREASELLQQGVGTNIGKLFPSDGGTHDDR